MALATPRCPTCRRETTAEANPFAPFCSERCKLVDLGNWMSERYRIPDRSRPPIEEPPDESDAGPGDDEESE